MTEQRVLTAFLALFRLCGRQVREGQDGFITNQQFYPLQMILLCALNRIVNRVKLERFRRF